MLPCRHFCSSLFLLRLGRRFQWTSASIPCFPTQNQSWKIPSWVPTTLYFTFFMESLGSCVPRWRKRRNFLTKHNKSQPAANPFDSSSSFQSTGRVPAQLWAQTGAGLCLRGGRSSSQHSPGHGVVSASLWSALATVTGWIRDHEPGGMQPFPHLYDFITPGGSLEGMSVFRLMAAQWQEAEHWDVPFSVCFPEKWHEPSTSEWIWRKRGSLLQRQQVELPN